MRLGAVLAAGIAVLAIAAGIALAQSEPRQAGSNFVPLFGQATELRGGDRHCQDEPLVPGHAAAVRILVGTYYEPTPELRVTMRDADGTVLSAGRLPAGHRQGEVTIPLDREIEKTRGGLVSCVATGPGRRTVLYGAAGRVRLEWLRPGEESWFALLPTVMHRFGLGKGLTIGVWLLPLALLLVLASWVAALRLVTRELAR